MAGWWAETVIEPAAALVNVTGGLPGVEAEKNFFLAPDFAGVAVSGGVPSLRETVVPTGAVASVSGGTPLVAVGRMLTPAAPIVAVSGGTPMLRSTVAPSASVVSVSGGTPDAKIIYQPVTHVASSVDNASSIAIPAHQIGDTIIVWAFRQSNTALPSKPAAGGTVPAWVDIDANTGANSCSMRTAYFKATATNTTTGTWTNASMIGVSVLRGGAAAAIGGHAESGGVGTIATGPAITPAQTDGTSVLLYVMGLNRADAFGGYADAPSGFATRAADWDGGGSGMVIQTKNSSTTDGAGGSGKQSSSTGYRGATIEVKSH